MSLSNKDYCSQVCRGKCCKVWDDFETLKRCPNLTKDNLCSIYKERYQENKPYSFLVQINSKEFLAKCGRIAEMLAEKTLPKWIEDQCCYAHPELLEEHEDKERSSIRFQGGKF